jgi:tetratricopeptide (TPR) repeat protein
MRVAGTLLVTGLVVVGVCGPIVAEDEVVLGEADLELQQLPDASCEELVAMGEQEYALVVCRDELGEGSEDVVAIRRLADLEFRYGEPERSAELWARVIELEGWSEEAASGRAMALWRAGHREEAEALMRDNVTRGGGQPAYSDLIAFLLSFNRWSEAAELAEKALVAYPDTCGYAELWGVAEAGAGNDAHAAELFGKAVAKGCPLYRWATLLDPVKLASGLDELDDRECEQRLQLLRSVVTPGVAPQITDEVLHRDKLEIRFEGIGLLSELGSPVMDSWKRLLADDDFVLRKYALRRIRELHDPAFIPLLEEHLESEPSRRNLDLTKLTLADLLLVRGDVSRAEALVREIPSRQPEFAVGLTALADAAESRGHIEQAVALFDEALAADPEVFVDRDRLAKLRAALEPGAEPEAEHETKPIE